MKKALSWVLVIGGIAGGYFWLSSIPREVPEITDVVVPEFSEAAARGEIVFQGTCAACHGTDLSGTENGPPLVYPNYRPASHADFAIYAAIKNGVVPHHWRFGAMPPQPGIADDEIELLTAYIREMQQANGIN